MSQIEPSPYALSQGRALARAPLVLAKAVRLGGTPESVFAFITDFPRLPEWMPLIKACRVDNTRAVSPGGVGAVRVIDSGFGKPTEETVVAFEAPRLLAYGASDASLMGIYTGHLGVLTCEAHPDGGAWLSWLSFANAGRLPMRWLGPSLFGFVIGKSLSNLKQRFPRAS